MFAHQVTKQMELNHKRTIKKEKVFYYNVIKILSTAERYHIGNLQNFGKVAGLSETPEPVDLVGLKFSYNNLYIDFTTKDASTEYKVNTMRGYPGAQYGDQFQSLPVHKGAVTATVVRDPRGDPWGDALLVKCFWCLSSKAGKDIWISNDHILHVRLDKGGTTLLDNRSKIVTDPIKTADICNATFGHLSAIKGLMNILQCKNVVEETIDPPKHIVKIRRKKKKVPKLNYKVLMVRQIGASGGEDTGEYVGLTPLHWSAGHYKTYTKERPLFGKYYGRFWWQPQKKGDAKNGVVKKRYDLTEMVNRAVRKDTDL